MTREIIEDVPLRGTPLQLRLYDWKSAPTWAQFAATDACGTAHYFGRRPYADRAIGQWQTRGDDGVMCETQAIGYSSHWTMSMERRP